MEKNKVFVLERFVPGLREELEQHPLDLDRMIRAAVPVEDPSKTPKPVPKAIARNVLYLTDGKDFCVWTPESLQSLFRGDKQPPVLGDFPEEYEPELIILETHVLEITSSFGPPRDEEMKEIYSNLRRRPDGRSLGFVHDHMWRAAAVMLGTRPLSKAEFEAIMSRLERSCRTFAMGPTSRNYALSVQRALTPGS